MHRSSGSRSRTLLAAAILLAGSLGGVAPAPPPGGSPQARHVRELIEKGALVEAEKAAHALIGSLDRQGKGDTAETAEALDLLVEIHYASNFQSPLGLPVARRAAESWLRLEGESLAYARSLYAYARLLHVVGKEREAQVQHEAVLAIRQRLLEPSHPDIGMSFNALGTTATPLGEWEAARSHYERALEIYSKSYGFERHETRVTLFNLAELHEEMGDYASARDLYQRLVQAMEDRPDPPPLLFVRAWSWISEMAFRLGDDQQARGSYARARESWDAARGRPGFLERINPRELANSLTRLATAARTLGETEQAQGYYLEALEMRERLYGRYHHQTAWDLMQLAGMLREQGDSQRARPYIDRACGILSNGENGGPSQMALCLQIQSGIMREMGEAAPARALIRRALKFGRAAFATGHPDYWELLDEQARLSLVTGHPDDARRQGLKAEGLAARQFFRTAAWLSQREALSYEMARHTGLDLALSALVGIGPESSSALAVEETWNAVIQSRGIVLDEIISRRRLSAITTDQRLGDVVRRLEADRGRLAHAAVSGPGETPSGNLAGELRALMKRQEATERELAAMSSGYRHLRSRQEFGLAQVNTALPKDVCLVAYVRYQRFPKDTISYLAFIADPIAGAPRMVPLGEAALIDGLVDRWRESAARPPSRGLLTGRNRSEEELRSAGNLLRQAVWDPIQPHLGRQRTVLVVPDGALNQVNLAALPEPGGRFLVESGRVFHYIAAEKDVQGEPPSPKGKGLLALGAPDFDHRDLDGGELAASATLIGTTRSPASAGQLPPLPRARAEVEQLAVLWNSMVQTASGEDPVLLTGADATEYRLKRLAAGRQVVHLATHGFSEKRNGSWRAADASPLLASGLALAGANACTNRNAACDGVDDGILLGEEILSLNLSGVEWVVLSACETGLGPIRAREGVQGLRRSFQAAGASTVITTLWKVEDAATRDWMTALYRARLRGRSTAESMRQASLDLIADARNKHRAPHPYYWAGFVAFGDWR